MLLEDKSFKNNYGNYITRMLFWEQQSINNNMLELCNVTWQNIYEIKIKQNYDAFLSEHQSKERDDKLYFLT